LSGQLGSSLLVLGALLLTLFVAGCGRFAGPVVEAQTTAKLRYHNPPLPAPVIPPNLTIGPSEYLPEGRAQVCMTTDDYVDLRIWMKQTGFWMKSATGIIRFHELHNRNGDGGDRDQPTNQR
jgi:hypothetical protein